MSPEIALVLAILVAALLLFVSGWLRMDLVALLVLTALALTGLVSAPEALAGFSNPAVITVWAMFILSEGLTRTGIADVISRGVLRTAGGGEARMIIAFMLIGGVLSGFMNNIGVAALLLPVAVDVARRTGIAPSRLLMPLAYGTLLGGLTTLIGTPPNLLVSTALAEAGHEGFRFFDFTYIGLPILLVGTAFVALIGRHLLPRTDPILQGADQRALRDQYSLQERIFALRVPPEALAAGKSIADSGLISAAGLAIIALTRGGRTEALPDRDTRLLAGDVLLAQGRLDRFNALRRWSGLTVEREAPVLHDRLLQHAGLYEIAVAAESPLIGERLRHREFRDRHAANVLAIRRAGTVRRTRLSEMVIAAGDRLLVQCPESALEGLRKAKEFDAVATLTEADVRETYRLAERLFVLRVPQDSEIAGTSIGESRIGDAFDFRLLALFREGALSESPGSDEVLAAGDLLLIQGREEDLDVLRGLQQLERLEDSGPYLDVFERGQLEMVEATLHPRSDLAGRKAADLDLRGRYQVELSAIWRDGVPIRSGLGVQTLQRGDALLIVGPRRRLAALNRDRNLVILNPVSVPSVDAGKAPRAVAVMLLLVAAVLFGLVPIAIAAIAGAALMVLSRCLTMEQAYRAIDWRTVFLIAGMLPLGAAMQSSGAANWLAGGVLSLLGPYGPWPVIAGLYGITVIGTLMVPTAVLVVLMAPIALSTSVELGILPHAPLMAVAIAAAASVASPVSHPANVLVMGPGGYRFSDFLKLGLPLALVVFLVAALLTPLVWPLHHL
jgi:di/tricarboxylate transporter